jgi:hypothetical protein
VVKKRDYLPKTKPAEQKRRYLPESLEGFKDSVKQQLIEFQAVVPGLPSLPTHPIKFEGWFKDVKKRLEITSQTRTSEAHLNALRVFNQLHEEWLRLAKMTYELNSVGARAKVDDLKIKAEETELKLQIAKTRAQILEIKTKKPIIVQPPPQPAPSQQPRESYEERSQRLVEEEMKRLETEREMEKQLIERWRARGMSEEDAKAHADEVIQKARKRMGRV